MLLPIAPKIQFKRPIIVSVTLYYCYKLLVHIVVFYEGFSYSLNETVSSVM